CTLLAACSGDPAPPGGELDAATEVDGPPAAHARVHVVLFTHVEDNTPQGTLGSAQSRQAYTTLRARLVETAQRFRARSLPWVLQPDWKLLEAARLYEDAAMIASTAGKNVFRYLHEDLGVVIDPHSHENGGYNYTDVAYLLDQLGVGGSTVIGGHIWDPALAQFQQWDRFRVAVAGEKYPSASWRGDLLIGAGTPNHVNDPLVSGVWRPADRDHYFDDDPDGNIVAVGAWHDGVAGVQELVELHASGVVPADQLLTASWNVTPLALADLATVEATVLAPMAALRDAGDVVVGDFRALVDTWRAAGARAALYRP
ncbi:MAG: hypothetical protein JNL83_20970, partial [Myxococcales bacterium]|nr:hypothetical protein [Myxococcales bacterium]